MAIAATHLTTNKSETDGTGYTTASITPTANALVLVMVSAVRADGITYSDPTLSGNGLTWVAIGTVKEDDAGGSRRGGTLFRSMGASPSAGAITITYGASHESCAWSVAEFTGVDTTGTNGSGAVVQVVTATGTSTTPSVTLAAFGSSSNATYGGCATGGLITGSAGTGFTQLGAVASVTPSIVGVVSEYQLANDTSVDMTLSGAEDWGIIGVEVKAAAGVVVGGPLAGGKLAGGFLAGGRLAH